MIEPLKITIIGLVNNPDYVKCPRCRKYRHISTDINFDNLCDYCTEVLVDNYPEHESVIEIKRVWLETNRFIKGSPRYEELFT